MGERENEELRSLPGENAQDTGHRRHPGRQHGSAREGPGAGMQGDSGGQCPEPAQLLTSWLASDKPITAWGPHISRLQNGKQNNVF